MLRLSYLFLILLLLAACSPRATISLDGDVVTVAYEAPEGVTESYASIINFKTDDPNCFAQEGEVPGTSCVHLNARGTVVITGRKIDPAKPAVCTIVHLKGLEPLTPDICSVKE